MLTLWNSGIPGPNAEAIEHLRAEVLRSWKLFGIHAAASIAAIMASVIEIGGVALLPPTQVSKPAQEATVFEAGTFLSSPLKRI